jgi:hypothetical protein
MFQLGTTGKCMNDNRVQNIGKLPLNCIIVTVTTVFITVTSARAIAPD